MDDQSATPAQPALNFRVPVEKQAVVQALLREGVSHRSIEKAVGLNRTTIAKIGKADLANTEQAEKIKKGLRNRWAVLADKSLAAIKPGKLKEANAKDLAYIAAKATEMAFGGEPSVIETYTKSMQAFLQPEPGQSAVLEQRTVTVTRPASASSAREQDETGRE